MAEILLQDRFTVSAPAASMIPRLPAPGAADGVEVISAEQALQNAEFVAAWDQVNDSFGHVNGLYSSPAWSRSLVAENLHETAIVALRFAGFLAGVVPFRRRTLALPLDVFSRKLAQVQFQTAELLGGPPVWPVDPVGPAELVAAIERHWPDVDGVYLDSVDFGFAPAAMLSAKGGRRDHFAVLPYGHRQWHLLDLASDFDGYLAGMSGKSRSTLRRKARLLEKAGRVEVACCRTPDDVPRFLVAAQEVSARSWQRRLLNHGVEASDATVRRLSSLANDGVLRCYSLTVAGRPAAYVLGYQGLGVFQYADLAFDESFAELSPGTALLWAIIEDLHRHDPPRTLNFGVGDASYKRRFGNRQQTDEAVLILKKTLRNRLAIGCQQSFLAAVEGVKRLVGRRVEK